MLHRAAVIALSAVLTSCGGSSDDQSSAQQSAAAPPAEPAAEASPAAPVGFERKPSPADAAVYFISPQDGATVQNPVRVVFGLRGFGVAPAGVERADAGHHHLLVDTEATSFDTPIPSDDRHRHFGLGQTETELTLPAGQHRLQLLLGDHLHVPHDPPLMSEAVTVQVIE